LVEIVVESPGIVGTVVVLSQESKSVIAVVGDSGILIESFILSVHITDRFVRLESSEVI